MQTVLSDSEYLVYWVIALAHIDFAMIFLDGEICAIIANQILIKSV